MKRILFFPLLILLSCDNSEDSTALFQDAFSDIFEYLSIDTEYLTTRLGVIDPLVFPTFAMGIDSDVIRHDVYEPEMKRILEKTEFELEQIISTWEKYMGNDLLPYVAVNHLHFLSPKDSLRERGTNISFSAPVFNADTSFMLFYMVFETNEENRERKFHRYTLFGKKGDSWKWQMESRVYEEI